MIYKNKKINGFFSWAECNSGYNNNVTTKTFLKVWTHKCSLVLVYLWSFGNHFFNICQTSYYVFKAGFWFNIAYKHDVDNGKNGWEVKRQLFRLALRLWWWNHARVTCTSQWNCKEIWPFIKEHVQARYVIKNKYNKYYLEIKEQ